MKECTECGAKCFNSAKICNDCGSEIKNNSEKKEEQRTYIEKTKVAAGNTGNDFANIKFTLQDINATLEKLNRENLSRMSEHLWWLALSAQIGLVLLFISIFIMILSIF